MATTTFTSAVFGQLEIASMVFGYQGGVYEDVRDALVACEDCIAFDKQPRGSVFYNCDASFCKYFAPNALWPHTIADFYPKRYALRDDERDDRLPLHVAIAEGFAQLTSAW